MRHYGEARSQLPRVVDHVGEGQDPEQQLARVVPEREGDSIIAVGRPGQIDLLHDAGSEPPPGRGSAEVGYHDIIADPAARHEAHRLAHPVVFIHELGMDNLFSFYYTLANPVAYQGGQRRPVRPAWAGLSERPRTGYRVTDSVADLAALLVNLEIEGPVHLVGNSYGGTVALSFAMTYPEQVASMVLIEAHVPIPGWAQQMATTITSIGAHRG